MDNNMDYLHKLTNDLLAQFRRQPNTQVLMSAIAKQLQSVYEVYEQLIVKRWLSNAEGKQLDGIGDIVVLSRTDAAKLELGNSNAGKIDDKVYRKYLYYKIFLNTSTGTRKEIMKALRFFWSEAPLYYSENPIFPATIFVDTPELAPDVPIDGLLEAPIIKPAGVRFIVRINTKTENNQYKFRIVGLSVVKITKTQVSEVEQNVLRKKLHISYAPQWKMTRSDTGEYLMVAGNTQHYNGLATVKITKTPLAAYGGN